MTLTSSACEAIWSRRAIEAASDAQPVASAKIEIVEGGATEHAVSWLQELDPGYYTLYAAPPSPTPKAQEPALAWHHPAPHAAVPAVPYSPTVTVAIGAAAAAPERLELAQEAKLRALNASTLPHDPHPRKVQLDACYALIDRLAAPIQPQEGER